MPGARCVSAPILDSRGEAVGAVSVSGPVTRLSLGQVATLADAVTSAARSISIAMGFHARVTATGGPLVRRKKPFCSGLARSRVHFGVSASGYSGRLAILGHFTDAGIERKQLQLPCRALHKLPLFSATTCSSWPATGRIPDRRGTRSIAFCKDANRLGFSARCNQQVAELLKIRWIRGALFDRVVKIANRRRHSFACFLLQRPVRQAPQARKCFPVRWFPVVSPMPNNAAGTRDEKASPGRRPATKSVSWSISVVQE